MTDEEMGARIADCLEEHLHDYRWEPYRYPSGEHKGVEFNRAAATVTLLSADGSTFSVVVRALPALGENHEATEETR